MGRDEGVYDKHIDMMFTNGLDQFIHLRLRDRSAPLVHFHKADRQNATTADQQSVAKLVKSPDEIRAVMAHMTNKEGATYTKKADRSRLADSGFVGLSSTEAERNLSNLSDWLETRVSQTFERKAKK